MGIKLFLINNYTHEGKNMLVYHRKISDNFCYVPFTARDRSPFFYIITHIKSGKRFAASKTSKGCHPSQLWENYFSSNKIVNALIYKEGKEAFTFEIRAIFDSVDKCKIYEKKFVEKVKAMTDSRWFNFYSLNDPNYFHEEIKYSKKLVWINDGIKEKRIIGNTILDGFVKGRLKGHTTKLKGIKLSEYQKNNISHGLKGHKVNQDTRDKIKIKNKEQPLEFLCQYCQHFFRKGHYYQWHGNKCKKRPTV